MPDVAAVTPAFLSILVNYNSARRRGRTSRALQEPGLNVVKAALKCTPQSLLGCLLFELSHYLKLSIQILKKEADKTPKNYSAHILLDSESSST